MNGIISMETERSTKAWRWGE